MFRLECVLTIVLLSIATACGGDGAATSTVAPSPTTVPATATGAPAATPQPVPNANAPTGLMRLADQSDDVTDVSGEPVADASGIVDLMGAALQIDAADLILTVDTGGPLPSTLEAGDEMWWALEMAPTDLVDAALYRVTVMFTGSTWQTISYGFEHDARQLPAQIDVVGSEFTVTIPLAELPKLNGPFSWWVASIWGGFDLSRADASGDRVPDGDPAWFPEGTGPELLTWDDLPSATAPLGLGAIQLPREDAAAAELVARIPETISGISRERTLEHHVTGEHPAAYGPLRGPQGLTGFELYLVALDAASPFHDWSPGTTGRDVITFFASGIDWTVDAAGRDAQLGWVSWHMEERLPNAATTRLVYSMAWADADSDWYFTASAESPEHLAAIVTAFVETAGTGAPQ